MRDDITIACGQNTQKSILFCLPTMVPTLVVASKRIVWWFYEHCYLLPIVDKKWPSNVITLVRHSPASDTSNTWSKQELPHNPFKLLLCLWHRMSGDYNLFTLGMFSYSEYWLLTKKLFYSECLRLKKEEITDYIGDHSLKLVEST